VEDLILMPSPWGLDDSGGEEQAPGAAPRHIIMEEAAVRITSLSKSFGGSLALSSLDLSIRRGEVHALLGENGSGKSTLIKVLSGYHAPDSGGSVLIAGKELPFGSPEQSHRLGCRFVHQDLGLIEAASVLDNLAMGVGYPTRFATIRHTAARQQASRALSAVGLDISPAAMIARLPAAQRTGVAVARALRPDDAYPPVLLVLDEPTASLPPDEVDHLLAMVQATARSGLAVLFVTHHIDEVFRIADRVSVLRDGRRIVTTDVKSIGRRELIAHLVGSAFQEPEPPSASTASSSPNLIVRGLRGEALNGLSFSASPGEIVGFAGLTGSGRDTVLGSIFGSLPRDGGVVEINGEAVRPGRPDIAISHGAGFMPADRKVAGGLMTLTALENLTIGDMKPFSSPWRVRHRMELAETRKWFRMLHIMPADGPAQPLASFSGGNQQKILFAKWLRLTLSVFLLDEPTQGVDVGSRAELHRQLTALAERGCSVVISSSDIEELAAICTRVLVVRRGAVASQLSGSRITVQAIKNQMMTELVPGGVQ
jgi:ribose transport system ATP-binding protein